MYTKEVFEKVKEELSRRRTSAEDAALARTAELRAKSRDIAEIDDELSTTGIQIFKAAISGRDIAPIRKRNLELNALRVKLLAEMGLPEDYTDAHYTCSVCQDTGYGREGTMCSCMRELIRLESIRSSGIGALIEKQSFENFDLDWYGKDGEPRKKMEENYRAIMDFADNFRLHSNATLLFIGNTGTGKTHLSTALAKRVIESGNSVIYDSVQNIISDFETDKFKSGYGPYEPRADKYLSCDLLIVDDLGTEFASQFTVSCIYNLINTRQNKGLATVISTNLSPAELSRKYEDRIYSRLIGSGSHIFLFEGRDHRVN